VTLHRVAVAGELWNGDVVPVAVAGRKIVLVKIDETVHAYADRCAHLGVPLSEGSLAGRVLTCSAHHWQYDMVTGLGVNPESVCLFRYGVKVEDGAIFVEIP
jgi:toluene monooxygenase system ferredoxin subunit